MKTWRWSNAATSRICVEQHPVAEHVAGHVADADDRERLGHHVDAELAEVPLDRSHAPRAVIPSALWSYPCEPPLANASPSQNP